MKKYLTVFFVGAMIFNAITLNAEPYYSEQELEQRVAGKIASKFEQDQRRSLLFKIAVIGLGAFISGQYAKKRGRNLKVKAGKAYLYAFDNYWIPDNYDSSDIGFQTRVNNTYSRRIGSANLLQRRSETYRDLGKAFTVTGAMMLIGGSLGLTLSVRSSENWTLRKDMYF